MNAGEVCKQNVVAIREFAELSAAAKLMRERHVGYLIVIEPTPVHVRVKPLAC